MRNVVRMMIVALFALAVFPASAQFKWGVKGGLNVSSVHFNSDLLKASNVSGFQIGPMIEAGLPLVGVGIDAAVLYSQKGLKLGSSNLASEEMKTSYLDVPVNLKWKFGLPVVKAYLAAGPYVGFRVGGDKIWDVVGDQIENKSFSAGLNFGAGVELISLLQVGFNYGLGLTDNYSAKKIDLNGKNRGWSVTAAILF